MTPILINEATQIPLWWFFVALFCLVGGIAWLTFIAWQSNSSAKNIDHLWRKTDTIFDEIDKGDGKTVSALENLRREMHEAHISINHDIKNLRQADSAQFVQLAGMREENLKLLMTIREDIAVIKSKFQDKGGSDGHR